MLRGRGRPGEAGDGRQAVVEHDHAGGEAGLHRCSLGGAAAAAATQEAAAEFHIPPGVGKGSSAVAEEGEGGEEEEEARPSGRATLAAGVRSRRGRSRFTHPPAGWLAGWPAGPVSLSRSVPFGAPQRPLARQPPAGRILRRRLAPPGPASPPLPLFSLTAAASS